MIELLHYLSLILAISALCEIAYGKIKYKLTMRAIQRDTDIANLQTESHRDLENNQIEVLTRFIVSDEDLHRLQQQGYRVVDKQYSIEKQVSRYVFEREIKGEQQ